jgi:nitrogen fixation/metabolism regulation signal transduction histidine kinase
MGRIERRLLALLVLVAGLPWVAALLLSQPLFRESLDVGLDPRIDEALEDALRTQQAVFRAERLRHTLIAEGLAHDARLLVPLAAGDAHAVRLHLTAVGGQPGVLAVRVFRKLAGPVSAPEDPVEGWTTERIEAPLPGDARLEYVWGIEAARLEAHRRLADEVLTPFHTLRVDRERRAGAYAWSFLAALGGTVLVASLVAVAVGRRLTRRLHTLREAMAGFSAGRAVERLPTAGNDEVADLMRAFEAMTRELDESRLRLEYMAQLQASQDIARRLAHEIKNPLTPILLSVQQSQAMAAARNDVPPALGKALDQTRAIVEEEVRALRRLVDDFNRFARMPTVALEPCDLNALVGEVVAAHPDVLNLAAHVPATPVVLPVDRTLLRQALGNLIRNAVEARPAGDDRACHVEVVLESAGPLRARLHVDDDGPGVPDELRDRVFDPYVTTKSTGAGLGLAIVKKVVLDHGGRIRVDRSPLGGARFTIELGPTPDPAI